MACKLDDDGVAELVVQAVRDIENDQSIQLIDTFDKIGVDDEAIAGYFGTISNRLKAQGCLLTIHSSAFDSPDTVQDLADIVAGGIARDDDEIVKFLAVAHPSWRPKGFKSPKKKKQKKSNKNSK